ncbi:MAG: hypothetical protein AAGH19_08520 [Pseudomonadota bacterium]
MRNDLRNRGQGPLWLGTLIALIAVAGIGYWLYGELQPIGSMDSAATNAESPSPARSAAPATGGPAEPEAANATMISQRAPDRTETILTCSAADGAVFYTNATRCEDADLDNRINVFSTPSLPASRPTDCLGAQPGGARVQGFLPQCRESFNEALSLEPFLLDSEEPADSRAARRYCAYITEGVQSGCMATSDQFCFLHLCQSLHQAGGS